MAKDTEYVLTLLEEYGMATHEQIVEARKEAMAQEDFELDAVDILCRKGVVQEMELLSMLAQQYGMEMIDLTDYEIQLHYNQAVNLYNADHYDEALAIADKAWPLANSNALYLQYVTNIGILYWHIYYQLGNDAKMKEFEKFKQ